ncbi:glucose-6-phosphate isomerase [Chloroflexota bacterium]
MERWRDTQWVNRMTIRLNFSQMMSDFIGENRGITEPELDELTPRTLEIADDIEARRESGDWGFFGLPYDIETANRVLELASHFQGRCDDFVVLGIGGSALGGIALFHALCHPQHNLLSGAKRDGKPRIFFLDNVDPSTIKSVLDLINPKRAVFNVITKSGSTVETLSQAMIVRQMLVDRVGEKPAKEQVVITTGAEKGYLRTLVDEGYPMLSIPDNVGGRYSVLSPVGLFPAAVAGIDILELLAGARHMDGLCRTNQLRQNPAYLSGALYYLANKEKGLNIAVMMPYSDALVPTACWFRQLWAESLGKAKTTSGEIINTGQTPIVAAGATDQHSLLQLFLEGPFDKMVTFLLVENPGAAVAIPQQSVKTEESSYLAGHSLEELIGVEARATQSALTETGRSSMSITLPEINPFTIGQLLFLLEVQTAFTGCLYNINPMDQPGVEAIKYYIYGMMGRSGYESAIKEVKKRKGNKKKYTI